MRNWRDFLPPWRLTLGLFCPLTFDAIDVLFGDIGGIEIIEFLRLGNSDRERVALVERGGAVLEFAGEDVATDFVVIAQEVPMVAGDVDRAHPRGTAEADEGSLLVLMLPSGLLFHNLDERPVGGRLGGDAAERQRGERAGDPNGVRRVATRQLGIELFVEIVERRSVELVDVAVFVEKRYGGERSGAVEVGGTDGSVGESLVDLAVEDDHFAIEMVERADAEIAIG